MTGTQTGELHPLTTPLPPFKHLNAVSTLTADFYTLPDNMWRLPCQLLSLCLTGTLLLPLCWGREEEYESDYDITPTPDYDYNATFEYEYFNLSNPIDYSRYVVRGSSDIDRDEDPNVERNMRPRDEAPKNIPIRFSLFLSFAIHQFFQLL